MDAILDVVLVAAIIVSIMLVVIFDMADVVLAAAIIVLIILAVILITAIVVINIVTDF